ncbi:MAG: sodium:proton antiporter [Lachnospiraceae bacterium]|nr:sodium:proton antiporter [Lachnospiraceae bacterium]
MDFICNFPAFSIVLSIMAAIVSSALSGKWAKRVNLFVLFIVMGLSVCVLGYTVSQGDFFVYTMGKFPAPWGNEIRAGVLEGLMATFFCVIMILSLLGGRKHFYEDVEESRHNLYFIMTNLLLSSLLAMVYTNDLFTAYVFVEINTIAACGLIMVIQNGRTIEAAIRYMIMSLLGSGLFLIGICILYDLTGHLLMSNIQQSVSALVVNGEYQIPLVMAIALLCVGLAIKSALYPFHSWLPDAYGYSTISSAAMLSSLVSKGYIFLVIKIIYRVIGFDAFVDSKIINILFVFGVLGMIVGSLDAIRENDIMRMIAFSSVAQIGYIYMGFGLGSEAGMVASVFHIFSHAATKALLFISAMGLRDASGGSKAFIDLTGAGRRNVIAGIGFTIGGLSMVGIPTFSGFVSKLLFSQAAIQADSKMLITLIALAISTILNAIYFMKTIIRIYSPVENEQPISLKIKNPVYVISIVCFVILNIVLGMWSTTIVSLIESGLSMFR